MVNMRAMSPVEHRCRGVQPFTLYYYLLHNMLELWERIFSRIYGRD
jgi:hypothetical protein